MLDLPRLTRSVTSLNQTKLNFIYMEVAENIRNFGLVLGRALSAQLVIALVNTLLTAMVVYLLVAQLWALVYTFLDLIDPASFNLPQGQSDFLLFEYYSFVTLTTLGYGDITPLTKVAKTFSVLEAVVGQLYLVVVVAWFVGMHVSRKSSNSNK